MRAKETGWLLSRRFLFSDNSVYFCVKVMRLALVGVVVISDLASLGREISWIGMLRRAHPHDCEKVNLDRAAIHSEAFLVLV